MLPARDVSAFCSSRASQPTRASSARGTESLRTLRRREPDSNHRSLSYDQYPNGLKKAPELCAHGQPRCVRTREMRGRRRYPDNRMVRRGPMSCPNALPKPWAPRVRLVGRTTELTTVGRRCSSPIVINCLPTLDGPPVVLGDRPREQPDHRPAPECYPNSEAADADAFAKEARRSRALPFQEALPP
jgi:hypothetical protein